MSDTAEKAKRRITERRRQQGREAQKRYREKQRAARANEERKVGQSKESNGSSSNAEGNLFTDSLSFDDFLDGNAELFSPQWSSASDVSTFNTSLLDSVSSLRFQNVLWETTSTNSALTEDAAAAPSIPMDTYVRVRRYSFYAASIENAFALGVTFDEIQNHSCSGNRHESAWTGTTSEARSKQIPVPTDLAPSEAQKKYEHSLYIDCLPFKDFREKLLALRSVEPKIFDEADFIQDLDFRDAFQCWGPTPWQSRSWEVQPWFLKKWWMLTGGEDGEMATSSRWWRMFRGELN